MSARRQGMRRARSLLCDHCGRSLVRLEGAAVCVRSRSGIILEISLHHRWACARAKQAEVGEVEITPATVFVANQEHVARLRKLAKVMSGASLSRLLRRLDRLASVAPVGAPTAASPAALDRAQSMEESWGQQP